MLQPFDPSGAGLDLSEKLGNQVISCHGINWVVLTGPCRQRGKIPTTCAMSRRNDMKYKYF